MKQACLLICHPQRFLACCQRTTLLLKQRNMAINKHLNPGEKKNALVLGAGFSPLLVRPWGKDTFFISVSQARGQDTALKQACQQRHCLPTTAHGILHLAYSHDAACYLQQRVFPPRDGLTLCGCRALLATTSFKPTFVWGFNSAHWTEKVGSCGEVREKPLHNTFSVHWLWWV